MVRTRFLFTFLALCALILGLAGMPGSGLRVAAADEEAADRAEDGAVRMQIEEPVSMEDFLRAVSKMTNMPLVWNPQDKNIRGKQILGGMNLTAPKDEFFSMVRSLLTFYELVMIPVGPADHQMILVVDARQTSSILKLKPQYVKLTDENLAIYENQDGLFITTTIVVEHMSDLRNARNALTRIVTGQNIGNVTEVPGMQAFVVTDFAPNVVAIYRLLKEMDQPGPGSTTTGGAMMAITLDHAVAVEVAAVLERHFAATAGAPVNRGQPSGAPVPSVPRISADARTNQILISGTQDQIETVQAAVGLLDVPIEGAQQGAYWIRLANIRASEAADALTALIENSPGLWNAGGPKAPRPTVISHHETNALLVAASDEDLARIRALIQDMDAKNP